MKQLKTFITIIFKKTLNAKAFFALALLIPIVGFGLSRFNSTLSNDNALVYLYSESDDEFSKNVFEDLVKNSEGYTYKIAASVEEIKTAVKSYDAICGYILVKDQPERIANKETNGNVILVERMGNAKTDTINEIFFSHYFREYTKYYAKNCVADEGGSFDELYDKLMDEALTSYSVEKLTSANNTKVSDNMIRNIIAVVLCLFSMLGIVNFITDCEHGIMYPIAKNKRVVFKLLYFLTPLITIYPFALITITLWNRNYNIFTEALYLFVYELLLTVICLAASYIIRSKMVMFGLIPVLTLLFIFICPVFIDLSNYIPVVNILRYICPPYFYMWL